MEKHSTFFFIIFLISGVSVFATQNDLTAQVNQKNGLIPPTNLTAEHLGLGVVELNWEFDPAKDFQHFNIYRNSDLIASVSDVLYLDTLPVFSIYAYEVTAFYDEGESQPAGPVEIEWFALPIIEVTPMEIYETHPCSGLITVQSIAISNTGEIPLSWELLIDADTSSISKTFSKEKTRTFSKQTILQHNKFRNEGLVNDIGVVHAYTGGGFSYAEPVSLYVKNFGTTAQSEIPYTISWEGVSGSGVITEVYEGSIDPGSTQLIISEATVNLFAYGEYYINVCTTLDGDENPDNDCDSFNPVNTPNNLITSGLYSSGCNYGDGLIYWDLANVNIPEIPCVGDPPWYHDYLDKVHLLEPGKNYVLTVKAGYNDTYFDVWINYDDDECASFDELILNDGFCAQANQEYTFEITIPDTVSPNSHVLRFRTNWINPVECCMGTYSYGNCCDFTAHISDNPNWLEPNLNIGVTEPGHTTNIQLTFNSEEMTTGTYTADIIISSREPYNPWIEIPVQLEVQDAEITYTWEPESFEFEFFITEDPGVDYLTIENTGTDSLQVDFEIEYIDPSEDEWLSINPQIANIPAGEEQIFEVAADPSYLYGYHGEANLILNTSDDCFPSQTIPVTVDVIGTVDEFSKAEINIFPNPAGDLLNIAADRNIEMIILQNHFGGIVMEKEVQSAAFQLDTSGLPGGVYFVTVVQNGRRSVHKVVIR